MNTYTLRAALSLSTLLASAIAQAQLPPPRSDAGATVDAHSATATVAPVGARTSLPPSQVREQIVGFNPSTHELTYVERMPTLLAGFAHINLVTIAPNVAPTRVRLTTEVDLSRVRTQLESQRQTSVFVEVENRVRASITAAAAQLTVGTILPAIDSSARNVTECLRAPFVMRSFHIGEIGDVEVQVSDDARNTAVRFRRPNGRMSEELTVPAVRMQDPRTSALSLAPYTRVSDARELPGTRAIALLLRSDACTPESVEPAVTAVLIEPPSDEPLTALEHTAITESVIIRLLSRRARRRTIDEISGWYDGRTRVVFDNAWRLPGSADLVLVQWSRHTQDFSPLLAADGHGPAHFALVRMGGRRPELAFMYMPTNQSLYEGTSQEAFAMDMDGDARPEIVIRSRTTDGSEYATILRWTDVDIAVAWTGEINIDGRRGGVSRCCTSNMARRCNLGRDERTLVLRCRDETYAGLGPNAAIQRSLVHIERIRFNGGSTSVEVRER
ncbi:MAG: hypothetical protein Q8Q09_00240 [Deltaproteobacteria bacterium]|nr:hypothetical protein [Deltaproteobacteria bacterium]